jgi:hypothetical protein
MRRLVHDQKARLISGHGCAESRGVVALEAPCAVSEINSQGTSFSAADHEVLMVVAI